MYDMNFAAAQLAYKIAGKFTADNPHKPRFVAGCFGPTNRTCSLSDAADKAGLHRISFGKLVLAYSPSGEGSH
jgi:5-methyltetrahydrofolate--homocysteine methyltransferase